MNFRKRKFQLQQSDNIIEISSILDKISQFEQQQPFTYLLERPNYKNTCTIPKIMSNDAEIKKQFRQLQKENQKSWRMHILQMPTMIKLKDLTPKKKKKQISYSKPPLLSETHKSFVYKQVRSKSIDKQYDELLSKLDLEKQFNETRTLIRRMQKNTINTKQVRFNTNSRL